MATFRYKVQRTVQVKQFEPVIIEAELTAEVKSDAAREAIAIKVEDFVEEHIKKVVAEHRKIK